MEAQSTKKIALSARFNRATFKGNADFGHAKFLNKFDFCFAEFCKDAFFRNLRWPSNPMAHHTAFHAARFVGPVDFLHSGFCAFSAYDGAEFAHTPVLDRTSDNDITKNFLIELEAIKKQADRETSLKELEAGCRVLKQEMAKQSDKHREQLLYRFELIAKREQVDTPAFEKAVSRIYENISDYGGSLVLPKVWLLILIWFSALGFMLLIGPQSKGDNLLLGFETSFGRIVPLSPFGELTKILADQINGQQGPLHAFAFMTLATVETAVGGILIFLFALAVRRRFQIN